MLHENILIYFLALPTLRHCSSKPHLGVYCSEKSVLFESDFRTSLIICKFIKSEINILEVSFDFAIVAVVLQLLLK